MPSFEPRIKRGLPTQLKQSTALLLFNIAWTFIAGEVSGNVSQVDRVWTFLPPLYTVSLAYIELGLSLTCKPIMNRLCIRSFRSSIPLQRI